MHFRNSFILQFSFNVPHLVCRFWFKLVGVYLQDEGTVIKKYLAAAFSLVLTLKEFK